MPSASIDHVRQARRVLFHGVTGAGKSTAAVRLGAVLGLPVTLVDEEFGWLPGWVPRPEAEQTALADSVTAGEAWVLDSAYGFYRPMVMKRTDVVIALDYSRARTFTRLVRRTIRRVVGQGEMCNGNRESWRRVLGEESILRWHAATFDRKRAWAREREAAAEGAPVLRLSTPRQWEWVLARLEDRRDRKSTV